METKICSSCKKEKPVDEFNWKNKSKGKRHARCKECVAKYQHDWYNKDPERKKHLREAMYARRKKKREWFVEYRKGLKCQKCGDDRWYVLDFHHRNPEEKEGSIGILIFKDLSLKRILKEIDKCDVLCSNCHRELHFAEKFEDVIFDEYE